MLEVSETHPAILAVKEVVDAIQALAQEHPDYRYSTEGAGCVYNPTPPNPMGCIVGEALRRCGHDTHSLDIWHEGQPTGSRLSGAAAVYRCALERCPNDADVPTWVRRACHLDWISKVQEAQDVGVSWAMAVQGASEWRGQASPPAAD